MHILSFHKATYCLFRGIDHKNLDATPSQSKKINPLSPIQLPHASFIPIATRPALLRTIHVSISINASTSTTVPLLIVTQNRVSSTLSENRKQKRHCCRLADYPCLTVPRRHKDYDDILMQQSASITRPHRPPLREYHQAVPS